MGAQVIAAAAGPRIDAPSLQVAWGGSERGSPHTGMGHSLPFWWHASSTYSLMAGYHAPTESSPLDATSRSPM